MFLGEIPKHVKNMIYNNYIEFKTNNRKGFGGKTRKMLFLMIYVTLPSPTATP